MAQVEGSEYTIRYSSGALRLGLGAHESDFDAQIAKHVASLCKIVDAGQLTDDVAAISTGTVEVTTFVDDFTTKQTRHRVALVTNAADLRTIIIALESELLD